jgi:uncharacterized protein (TIGR02453 family)
MADKYDGITDETFWLLGQNKFNNSKEFYETNKSKIKIIALQPMLQIAQIISGDMEKIDDKMNLIPSKMISRIRRDTRFSRDKSLYRENIWIMFMRPKAEWPNYPCMWFEITPHGYSYGVSSFDTSPRYMEVYRKALLERPDEFLKAAKEAEAAGARFYAENYKKEKPAEISDELKKYYNVKNMYFMAKSDDLSRLKSSGIITELKTAYGEFAKMYNFLKCVSDEYASIG